jgi:hypothetical protein
VRSCAQQALDELTLVFLLPLRLAADALLRGIDSAVGLLVVLMPGSPPGESWTTTSAPWPTAIRR